MSSLINRTRDKLKSDPRPLTQISIESQLPYHWLSSFKYGRSASPGAAEVQQLYEFLTGKPLLVE